MRYLALRAALAVAATVCLLPFGAHGQSAPKALVYCPVGIDAVGCTNISTTLAEKYPGGVDLGYDGASGTVDLRTVDLWQYEVVIVPSLADNEATKPYALLRDPVVAERLHDALMGRIAMWSGTPDLGTATSPNRAQKNVLIANLAGWASGNYATVKGPGLVTFLDQSETATARYDWVQALTKVNVIADLKLATYASVSALTATGTSILTSGDGLLAYTNMASFGFQLPSGAAGVSLDAVGQTGTTVGGQVVLLTSAGGNSGGAVVKTDLDDYAPGTTVVMTGTGWQPGETVSLTLHEDPLIDADRTFTTVADASGNLEFTGFAPEQHDIDVRFILTAVGGSSGLRAQTTFTDGVTFAGSTTNDNAAGGTSLMVGTPEGVGVGDLLLAQITFTGGNTITTLTPPAGWTALPRDNSGSSLGQVIYWRVADGSEPASYTWGFSGSTKATGGIVRYSAVDIGGNLNPIAASGSTSGTLPTGLTTTLVAPSVTTPTRSTMVVTFFSVRAAATLSTPVGMTERHQRANVNAAAPLGPSIMASEVAQFETGETGMSTSTANERGAWVAHTVAIDWRQSGSGGGSTTTPFTVNRPADATAGDLLLANIMFRGDATVTVTPPSGWTLIAKRTNTGTPITQATYWRIAGISEPATYVWGLSTALRGAGGITAYTGIDTDSPIDGVATNPPEDLDVVASTDMTAPSVTTTVPGAIVAALYALDANTIVTAPAGMLLRYQFNSSTNSKVAAADVLQDVAGPSGPKVATGAVAVRWVAQTIALRRRPRAVTLVFSTPAQAGLVNACLGPITIQTQDEYDRPVNVVTNLAVNLATSGTGEFFTASGCATPPGSNAPIAAGTSSTSVWYKALVLGTGAHELSAAASAMAGASQVQTIDADPEEVPPATVIATLVGTTQTSQYSPPSPDPSGIAYAAHLGRLVIVDGEVEETGVYGGANVFETTPSGSLTGTWTTTAFSMEPVGAAYNPVNGHLFLSDDDTRRIFEIDPGADGQYSTSDDRMTSFDTRPFGSDDPEGLAFDGAQGVLFIVDGKGAQVYRVSPGANGIFDGVTPVGDDQVSSFDIEVHGVLDPEGIAFDSDRGHLLVVGHPNTRVFQLSTTGVLLGTIDISAANADKPSGLEYLPADASSGGGTLYIVDRRVDNDTEPSENDGRLYQFSLPVDVVSTAVGNITASSSTYGGMTDLSAAVSPAVAGSVAFFLDGGATPIAASYDAATGVASVSGYSHGLAASASAYVVRAAFTPADGNYQGSEATNAAALAVAQASQAIAFDLGGVTATYGDAPFTVAALASGGASGNALTFTGEVPGACSVTPTGEVTIAATGLCTITANQAGNTNYVAASPVSRSFSVSARALTVTATGISKEYDGTTAASVTLVDDRVAGDVLTTAYTDATFTDKNVGIAKPISVNGITLSGAAAANYTVNTTATSTANITARPLTITASAQNKVYDGTTTATVTLADDRISGDVLTTTFVAASFSDGNVGTTKTVTVSGIAISGTAAQNYTFSTTVLATADITPASATITLGNLSQLWNGAAKAATATTTPTGLAVTFTYSQNGTPVAAPTNAGFYDVVATISNPNYRGTATGILVILNRIDIIPGTSQNVILIADTRTPEIAAAILGTVTFDARTVVQSSVTLGDGIGADAPVNTTSTGALRASISDVNADGRPDLVVYFKKATVISMGNVTTKTKQLIVRATLTNGAPIRGTDKVTVRP